MAAMWMIMSICLAFTHSALADLPTCSENDFHYEFTECDSFQGRWRVSVPTKPNSCQKGTPKQPRREEKCDMSCPPGQFLDVNTEEMQCKKCPAGTYSLGGGVRYTSWDQMPQGFEVTGSPSDFYYDYNSEHFYYTPEHESENSTCKDAGWSARGEYAASSDLRCTSRMTYAVTLVKKGYVKFKYQSVDDNIFFRFYVRNSQCVAATKEEKNGYPSTTEYGEWKEYKVNLEAGRNLVTWDASNIDWEDVKELDDKRYTPVLVKDVFFEGVGFTSECSECDPGTYSAEGAEYCELCPDNHFSPTKATECLQCNTQTQYSMSGSANCSEREPCVVNDFYETRSDCDGNGKTKVMYKWTEPKICREDIEGAKALPPSGAEEDCKHCNPGMFMNTTSKACQYCKEKMFSNGTECKACPVGTTPEYEYDIKWWNDLPPNMRVSCYSGSHRGCATRHGWQLHNTYLTSGTSHGDDVYMWFRLSVDSGFAGSESVVNGKPGQVGMLSFQFEMTCTADCVLKLKENSGGSESIINTWNNGQPRTNYKYIVTSTRPTTFVWSFVKSVKTRKEKKEISEYKYINDKINIYYVKVDNLLKGGASKCRKCPLGSKNDKCAKCGVGNYLDSKLEKCFKCPANTYLNVSDPYEKKSCIPCGEGLHSPAGSTECFSDCRYVTDDKHYDFTALSGFHQLAGGASFTSRGSRYYHMFNISLCGHEVDATCNSNISVGSGQKQIEEVSGSICRLTMIPTQDGQLLAGQPMVLSHQLLSVSEKLPSNLSEVFGHKSGNNITDFVFNYQSALKTVACSRGFSSHIILRCDMTAPGEGVLSIPPKCPEGTCDGCRFMFLFRTKYACPLCQTSDFTSVTTACVHTQKSIHFMWNEPKFCRDGVHLPEIQNKTCSIFEQTVGSAVVDFKIVLSVAALLAVLLVFAVIGLWYRNRTLSYKYTRLVNNASGKLGELPAVERCALEEDEEDNDEEVHFKKHRGKNLMSKLRNITGSKRDEKSRNFLGDSEEEEYESHDLHVHNDDRI